MMNEQKANFEAKLDNLTVENQQLMTESGALQKQIDNYNWMLGVILQFNTFPVREYCPQKSKWCWNVVSMYCMYQYYCLFSSISLLIVWVQSVSHAGTVGFSFRRSATCFTWRELLGRRGQKAGSTAKQNLQILLSSTVYRKRCVR